MATFNKNYMAIEILSRTSKKNKQKQQTFLVKREQNLEGSTGNFRLPKKTQISAKPPTSWKSFLNLPGYIIHELTAAVGLIVCHGLFTEVLMNPLGMNIGKAKSHL